MPFLIAYFCFRRSIYCKPEAQCLAHILRLTFLYFVLSISLAANLLDVNMENLVVILLCFAQKGKELKNMDEMIFGELA